MDRERIILNMFAVDLSFPDNIIQNIRLEYSRRLRQMMGEDYVPGSEVERQWMVDQVLADQSLLRYEIDNYFGIRNTDEPTEGENDSDKE